METIKTGVEDIRTYISPSSIRNLISASILAGIQILNTPNHTYAIEQSDTQLNCNEETSTKGNTNLKHSIISEELLSLLDSEKARWIEVFLDWDKQVALWLETIIDNRMNYDRISSLRHIAPEILKEITGERILETPIDKLEEIGHGFYTLEQFRVIGTENFLEMSTEQLNGMRFIFAYLELDTIKSIGAQNFIAMGRNRMMELRYLNDNALIFIGGKKLVSQDIEWIRRNIHIYKLSWDHFNTQYDKK